MFVANVFQVIFFYALLLSFINFHQAMCPAYPRQPIKIVLVPLFRITVDRRNLLGPAALDLLMGETPLTSVVWWRFGTVAFHMLTGQVSLLSFLPLVKEW